MPHDAKYLDNQYKQRHALELKQAEEKAAEKFAAAVISNYCLCWARSATNA